MKILLMLILLGSGFASFTGDVLPWEDKSNKISVETIKRRFYDYSGCQTRHRINPEYKTPTAYEMERGIYREPKYDGTEYYDEKSGKWLELKKNSSYEEVIKEEISFSEWERARTKKLLNCSIPERQDYWWKEWEFYGKNLNIHAYVKSLSTYDPHGAAWFLLGGKYGFTGKPCTKFETECLIAAEKNVALYAFKEAKKGNQNPLDLFYDWWVVNSKWKKDAEAKYNEIYKEFCLLTDTPLMEENPVEEFTQTENVIESFVIKTEKISKKDKIKQLLAQPDMQKYRKKGKQ